MYKLSYIIVDLFSSFGTIDQVRHVFRRLREIGFEGVEFGVTYPLGLDVLAVKEAAVEAGIDVCSILSGWSYFQEKLCISSPNDEIRGRAISRMKDYVAMAASLGSLLVVGQMQGFPSDNPSPSDANERIADSLAKVSRVALDRGVQIVLEPVNHLQCGFNNTVGEVLAMVEKVGSPALRPMVDTIHMNIEDRSVTEPIYRAGKTLGHVHLCETNGGPLGSGHLDVAAVLNALTEIDYQRYVSVKIYRHASWEDGATAAMTYLRNGGRCR